MDRRRRIIDLVVQRIEILDKLAFESLRKRDLELARNAGMLIRKLYLRNRVKVGVELKRRYCKKCYTPLAPGVSCRVRIRGKGKNIVRIVTCLTCGSVYRLELSKKGI